MTSTRNVVQHAQPISPSLVERIASGSLTASDDFDHYPAPAQPMDVARRLVGDVFTSGDGHLLLRFWRGDWWSYTGDAWVLVEDELEVLEPIWERLGQVTYGTEGEEKQWNPSTSKVHNLLEPLQILTRLKGEREAPMWVNGSHDRPKASNIVAMRNGLLDITSRELMPHTPEFFTTWALPFDYDEDATCPTWRGFLDDGFAHDPNGAKLLQEFAGYLISGATNLHRALMITGPTRAGKGTISKTLRQLVGTSNTVSTTLNSLGSEFGVAPLIGKPLAVFEDARADASSRSSLAVERLLNIVGEDAVSANRKNQSYWNGTLPTRFVLVSNEVPRFPDASGAIVARFVTLKLVKSHKDNQDSTLGHRINLELPGIFRWALAGLDRLNRQGGRFTLSGTDEETRGMMSDLASPVAKFLDERFTVTGSDSDHVTVKAAHGAYKLWCEEGGYSNMNQGTFVQRVMSAEPRVTFKNTRVDGQPKARLLFGLKKDEWFS